MDTFLANHFGTNQSAPEPTTEADDLEKMAQLVMLDKIAEGQNIDLSSLSDEEYVNLANQVFNGEQEKTAAEAPQEEYEKVAQARFEEAKFLGQVVAHSMWNELDSIQKHAMAKEAGVLSSIGKRFGKGKATAAAAEAAETMSGRAAKAVEKGFKPQSYADEAARKAGVAAREAEEAAKATGKKVVGGTAAAATGLGATALGAKALMGKKKDDGEEKNASAFDTLSDARAYEILQHYGLADGEGNVVSPEDLNKHAQAVYQQHQQQAGQAEKTAADKLTEAVEMSAWEKLAGLGYDPDVINYLLQVQQGQ